MSAQPSELRRRLELVRAVLERTPDPLDVPLGVRFTPLDGEAHVAATTAFAERARAGRIFAGATLYVHVPFCARVCTYCLLSSARTPGKAPVDAYVAALRQQIALVEPLVRGLRFSSIHVGGGTPTLLSEAQLDGLLGDLARFERTETCQIGVEAHPATATPAKLELLARHGVHRVSFGVESFTPEVLRAVHREDQTAERVRAAVLAARRAGLSINVDMLAGLPSETRESFDDSMREALALEPDSMSVNRFLAENSPLERLGYAPDDAENRLADAMLMAADRRIRETSSLRWPERPLARAGFGTQYVWDRSDRARSYFQDDMIGPASTIALGHGALGHLHAGAFSIPAGTHEDYVAALEAGRAPAMLASAVTPRFEMAFFFADHAVRGDLSLARFAEVFGGDARRAFGPELAFLAAEGLLRIDDDRVVKPPNPSFQVTHLFAFLLRRADHLAADLAALDAAPAAPRSAALAQYDAVRDELPPSLLWCRLAIRAAQSVRGAQLSPLSRG
jgi:oxygen-independent coproporphyrinogen-3 oxidase